MSPRKIEIHTRFWSKVDKSGECWEWTASKTHDGYGRFGIGRKVFSSHRIAYEMVSGPIPDGLLLDHTCHNRACVNPDHLRLVTHKQNLENREGATIRNLSSGIRGVSFHKRTQKWQVAVGHNRKVHYGGLFATAAEAGAAAVALRNSLFTHNDADKKVA